MHLPDLRFSSDLLSLQRQVQKLQEDLDKASVNRD